MGEVEGESRPIDFAALRERFAADEIEWRLQSAGEKSGRVWALCVPYVTARAIQARLDEVCGPENWWNEYRTGPAGGILCGITIRTEHGPVTKWDGAENTDVEKVKGGLSAAFKRAAVQWGIGRYLYALDETFAQVNDNGKQRGKTKQGSDFRWDPPRLPAWALPGAEARAATLPQQQPAPGPSTVTAAPSPIAETETAAEPEHETMVLYIRKAGAHVNEGTNFRVDGRSRNLTRYVRENWDAIKETPALAKMVVQAIERATGTTLASFVEEAKRGEGASASGR